MNRQIFATIAVLLTITFFSCKKAQQNCLTCSIPCKVCNNNPSFKQSICNPNSTDLAVFTAGCTGGSGSSGVVVDSLSQNTTNCYDNRDIATSDKQTKELLGYSCILK